MTFLAWFFQVKITMSPVERRGGGGWQSRVCTWSLRVSVPALLSLCRVSAYPGPWIPDLGMPLLAVWIAARDFNGLPWAGRRRWPGADWRNKRAVCASHKSAPARGESHQTWHHVPQQRLEPGPATKSPARVRAAVGTASPIGRDATSRSSSSN